MSEWWPAIWAAFLASTFAGVMVEIHVSKRRYGRAAGFSLFCVLFMLFLLAKR